MRIGGAQLHRSTTLGMVQDGHQLREPEEDGMLKKTDFGLIDVKHLPTKHGDILVKFYGISFS